MLSILSGPGLKKFSSALSLLLLFFPFYKLQAQGDLQLMKKRIVFEGSRRLDQLHVVNTGKDTAFYNISLVQNRMLENGAFELITEPDSGQYFADKHIRIFPRRVELAPGESQTIKVQVTRASELVPGEYRSHLYFRAEPRLKALGEGAGKANEKKAAGSGITMKIVPVIGVSIPVIIRVGESTARVTITDLALQKQDNAYKLNMTLNRSGNMSVYGDIEVQYLSADGRATEVGSVKGFAVYTPNARRIFQLDLKKTGKVDFSSGKLMVTYKAQDGEQSILTEAVLSLQAAPVAAGH